MKTKKNTRVATWLALAMGIAAAGGTAHAAAMFTYFQMPANTTNVATMSLETEFLNSISQLSSPGSNVYNVIYTFITPTVSGAYSIGIPTASYDPVLLMYGGQTSFPSSNPNDGLMALNDDGQVEEFNGLAFSNTSVSALWNSLLQDINLTAGTSYMIAATSFRSGTEIPLPLDFFVYGEPVSISTSGGGETSALPEASTSLGLLALGAGGLLTRRRTKRKA